MRAIAASSSAVPRSLWPAYARQVLSVDAVAHHGCLVAHDVDVGEHVVEPVAAQVEPQDPVIRRLTTVRLGQIGVQRDDVVPALAGEQGDSGCR